MENWSDVQLERERRHRLAELEAIPARQDELEDELEKADQAYQATLSRVEGEERRKRSRALRKAAQRRHQAVDALTDLNLQRAALADQIEVIVDEQQRRKQIAIRKRMREIRPALRNTLIAARDEAVRVLADVAALTVLVDDLPPSTLHRERIARNLDPELFHTHLHHSLRDLAGRYQLDGVS